MIDMSNGMVRAFEKAAGAGCAYELRLRMLADSTKPIQEHSMAFTLENLETPLIAHFRGTGELSEADASTLQVCRRVRNKLLHAELHTVRKRLIEEAGAQIASAGVMSLNLTTQDVKPVTRDDTAPGNLFGWLLESANSGDFAKAEELFRKGEAIVVKLAFGNLANQ